MHLLKQVWKRNFALVIGLALLGGIPLHARGTELLWDRYGVPHIFAADIKSLFRTFAYAQMHSHGDLLLRLYGQARGRAAEYWGSQYVESDEWVRTTGIPGRAAIWYREQTPEFRGYLDAFAEGINLYAHDHPGDLSSEFTKVLPVTAIDILAHTQRIIDFTFVTSIQEVHAVLQSTPPQVSGASNAWAIAGKRTESGNAILLANPHLPWVGSFLFYEAELQGPGINAYGATLVGFPVLGIAFNDHLGWTHTVNLLHAHSFYVLTPATNGYYFDHSTRQFDVSEETMWVRQPDGRLSSRRLVIRRSVQGPVVGEKNGRPVALRITGSDASRMCQEWWDMARARNLSEFESALAQLQLPMFNVVYADRGGHIMYVFNGRVPVWASGDWNSWSGLIPGDSSTTLSTTVHKYSQLPRVLDPPSGWLQSTNDPPWTATLPPQLDPAKFPPYMAPPPSVSLRTQRSLEMLMQDSKFSFEDVVRDKYSTRADLADRIVDELVEAALKSGNEQAIRAARVLSDWDRTTNAESRGSVLFDQFCTHWMKASDTSGSSPLFATPWSWESPLRTPRGLGDPQQAVLALSAAAKEVEESFGRIDVPWGEVHRFRRDNVDLPGNGAEDKLGIFRVINYASDGHGVETAVGGDSFVMVVEFGKTAKAEVLLGYGNASQASSRHRSDEVALMAHGELRPVWRTRREVMQNLEKRVTF